jgi:hypothetical protein
MREVGPCSMRQPRESPAPARPGGATLADRSSHSIRPEQVEAILDGSEKITRKLLDAVDLDHAAQARPVPPARPRRPCLHLYAWPLVANTRICRSASVSCLRPRRDAWGWRLASQGDESSVNRWELPPSRRPAVLRAALGRRRPVLSQERAGGQGAGDQELVRLRADNGQPGRIQQPHLHEQRCLVSVDAHERAGRPRTRPPRALMFPAACSARISARQSCSAPKSPRTASLPHPGDHLPSSTTVFRPQSRPTVPTPAATISGFGGVRCPGRSAGVSRRRP